MSVMEDGATGLDPGLVRWGGYGLAALGTLASAADFLRPSAMAAVAMLVSAPLPMVAGLYAPELFDIPTGGGGRTFNPVMGFPALGACFVAFDRQLADPTWAVIAGLGVGVLALAYAWTLRGRPGLLSPNATTISIAVIGALLGFSFTVVADVQLDPAPATLVQAPVLEKYVTHSKDRDGYVNSTSYHVQLAPWGPRTRADSVGVSYRTYSALQVGDPLCILERPGALGLPWFTTRLCQEVSPT